MNAADRELLVCLIEECSEVIHAATKYIRHGADSYNPTLLTSPSNKQQLNKEIGDLGAIMELLDQRAILSDDVIHDYREGKLRRLNQYLHHNNIRDGVVTAKKG